MFFFEFWYFIVLNTLACSGWLYNQWHHCASVSVCVCVRWVFGKACSYLAKNTFLSPLEPRKTTTRRWEHIPQKSHYTTICSNTVLACWSTTWDSCGVILIVLGVTVASFFNLATPLCFHVQAPDIASMYIVLGGLAFCHMVGTNKHEWTKTSAFWKPG